MEQRTITYKIATEPDEMEQIYQLNYETFVEEIPQHAENRQHRLVDPFDKENVYFIAKNEREVIGMIAVRANRPFSLDRKLDHLDDYLPKEANPCEVRLLSVKKGYRKSWVFYQLVTSLVCYCLQQNYNMALISGTDRQYHLYRKIGFVPFGPQVGTAQATFQPMYLTKERFETSSKAFMKMMERQKQMSRPINFLPGPVAIHEKVNQAYSKTAISHRSDDFIDEMKTVRTKLCELVHSNHAQIVVGTGTLANDLVAAQLKSLPGKGLIIANGEFGCRLIDHATRFGLRFETLKTSWNEKMPLSELDGFLKNHDEIGWIWTVHCETSAGYLFDLTELVHISKKYRVKLCLDACSSVGVVPVDFQDVHLASTVSGKGLGSYPGLAIVFHKEHLVPNGKIPRYLDLGQYAAANSIPYTHSSNLVFALHAALDIVDFDKKVSIASGARRLLKSADIPVMGTEDDSPGILTIPLPESISSKAAGDRLKESGILMSYESDYLLQRNWLQFAFMGDVTWKQFEIAFPVLKQMMES